MNVAASGAALCRGDRERDAISERWLVATTPIRSALRTNRAPASSRATLILWANAGLGARKPFSTSLIIFFETDAAALRSACEIDRRFRAAWRSTAGKETSAGKALTLTGETPPSASIED